jgi:hypothetical protein
MQFSHYPDLDKAGIFSLIRKIFTFYPEFLLYYPYKTRVSSGYTDVKSGGNLDVRHTKRKEMKGETMETNGNIITGTYNRVDTRLLDGEYKHVYISLVDLHHVTVVGVPSGKLTEFFDNSSQTLDEFNKLIESVGICSPDDDVFAVSVSDTDSPRCVKIHGANDFMYIATPNSDGIRFSIFKDDGRDYEIEYTHEQEDA